MKNKVDISYRRIFAIATPVMLTQVTYTAMGFIDTVMVGRLGVTALAGVGLGALTVWWLLSFLVGALSGVNTAVAQSEGAGDRFGVGRAVWHGLFMGIVIGVVLVLFWPLIPTFFRLVDPGEGVRAVCEPYMKVRLLSAITLVPLLVADSFYRGLGRTFVPMVSSVVQLILNCLLNYAFIFGRLGAPELGAWGSALGTVLAQLLVGLVLFLSLFVGYFRREYRVASAFGFDSEMMRGLLIISVPIGLQHFMEMGGVSVFSIIIARLGEAEMAATQAVIQNWSVAFMAGFGLSVTGTTLTGQCVGAGDPTRARLAVKRVLRIGYLLMAALAAVYLLLPEQLMALFAQGHDLELIRPFARPVFRVVVVCLILDLWFMVFSGALRGAGDTAFPMWVNILSAWLLFVPVVAIVGPRYGMVAAFWCFVLHLAVMSTVLALRFRSDGWMGKSLRDRMAADQTHSDGASLAEGGSARVAREPGVG